MALIRRATVDQYEWLTQEQFNRDWSLCQMTPGINLIGRRIAGFKGAVICVFGMLFPSALVTVLLTGAYVMIREEPSVQSVLHGLLPASVGLGLVTAFQMGRVPVKAAWRGGMFQMLFVATLIVGSGYLLVSGKLSVTLVLLASGLIGAVEGLVRSRLRHEAKSQ